MVEPGKASRNKGRFRRAAPCRPSRLCLLRCLACDRCPRLSLRLPAFGDFGKRAPGFSRLGRDLDDLALRARDRILVLRLDQQPVVASFLRPSAHPHQMPVAFQLLAFEAESQMNLLQCLGRIAFGNPAVSISLRDGTRAVVALGDQPPEGAAVDRLVLDLNREAPLLRIEAGAPRHRPGVQYAVMLEPAIVVESRRTRGSHRVHPATACRACLRVGRPIEMALGTVCGETIHGRESSDDGLRKQNDRTRPSFRHRDSIDAAG